MDNLFVSVYLGMLATKDFGLSSISTSKNYDCSKICLAIFREFTRYTDRSRSRNYDAASFVMTSSIKAVRPHDNLNISFCDAFSRQHTSGPSTLLRSPHTYQNAIKWFLTDRYSSGLSYEGFQRHHNPQRKL